MNFKLRVKLLLAFGSILLLTLLLFVKFFQTLDRLNSYQILSEKVDGVNIHLLEMDAAAQYFIFEGYRSPEFLEKQKSPFIELYQQNLSTVKGDLELIRMSGIFGNAGMTESISYSLDSLDATFKILVNLFKRRGFKDYGLEGQLRRAIHSVENSSYQYDKADMLTLRRHEKDFFLRKDLKYQDEFNKKLDQFISTVQMLPVSESQISMIRDLQDYKLKFTDVVAIDTEIGLKEDVGKKGIFNKDLGKLKSSIQLLRSNIKERSSSFKQYAITTLITLFVIQLAVGILLTIVYANVITKAIKEFRDAMTSLANGLFPAKLEVKSTEEIGQTKQAFNQLLDRMHAAQEFSEELGNGKLKASYNSIFTEDILARSLLKMQLQLVKSSEEQEILNWSNVGIAKLNDVLKMENAEIQLLGDKIVKLLVEYVNANQGAIYIIHHNGSEHYAERVATYAYNKKKFVDQRIEAGQGLVGQCIFEKSTIVMTDIPQDYVKITSGLGEANPNCVVILPLLIQNKIEGILELASFEKFQSYQIQFLEKIGEIIASILANKKNNLETSRLLGEAQQRAELLATQEEEIRQNAEEMQAIQEQLEREKKLMEQEIVILKSRLKDHVYEVKTVN